MANIENIPPNVTKCGHCGWVITALIRKNIKDHNCFSLFDEATHVLSSDGNSILMFDKDKFVSASNDEVEELQQSKRSNTKGKMTKTVKSGRKQIENEYNEKLIAAVQERPPLYDCRLPLKSRNNLKKEALWKEVANIVQGNDDCDRVRKRWTQLRDSYMKARRKKRQYIPSGSAAAAADELKNTKFSFTWFNQLQFLDDVLQQVPTDSNFEDNTVFDIEETHIACEEHRANSEISISETSNISISSQFGSTDEPLHSKLNQRASKKRKIADEDSDIKKAILAALDSEPQSKQDAVDGFFLQIGDRLRALPVRERHAFEVRILSQLYDLESELFIV